jgi:hypothetical protein
MGNNNKENQFNNRDNRPEFEALDMLMKAWVVYDIAKKIIEGSPSLAILSAKVFRDTDSISELVWKQIQLIVKAGKYGSFPHALSSFNHFINGLKKE